MRLTRLILPTFAAAGLLTGATALAAGNFGLDAAAGNAIPHTTDIAALIGKFLQTALGFVGAIFLLITIYAGFLWMTAQGDEKKVGTAKTMITQAVAGMVVIAGAYAITSFVLGAVTGGTSTAPPTAQTSGTGSGTGSIGTKQKGEACTSGSDCAAPNICDIGNTNTCI